VVSHQSFAAMQTVGLRHVVLCLHLPWVWQRLVHMRDGCDEKPDPSTARVV